MRIFSIQGKFTHAVRDVSESRWSEFEGFFIKEDGKEEIAGVIKELYDTGRFNPIRYIKGFYIEETNQLLFLKLSPSKALDPLLYSFYDINETGMWAGIEPFSKKFFVPQKNFLGEFDIADGNAKISIVEENNNERDIRKKINLTRKTYRQIVNFGLQLNIELIKQLEEYKQYLNCKERLVIIQEENN